MMDQDRGPNDDHIKIRIWHSGSQALYKGDTTFDKPHGGPMVAPWKALDLDRSPLSNFKPSSIRPY